MLFWVRDSIRKYCQNIVKILTTGPRLGAKENCHNLIYLLHASIGRIVQSLFLQTSKSDCKAFLLIYLKKCLTPYENCRSKVISILLAGNILQGSSSASQQHKSVLYKWLSLHLHRDALHTDLLQPHSISCRGASGAGGNVVITEIYLSKSGF